MNISFTLFAVSFLAAASIRAEEPVDLDLVNRIRDEGFNRSEVMESLRVLADEIGPRLTASPGMRAASQWTVNQLQDWGLENVHLEGFEFGRGWSLVRSEVHMTSPRRTQLHGMPVEWYPGTDGVLEGEIVHAMISSAEDFPKWEGKLQGKMVLLDEVSDPVRFAGKSQARFTEAELDKKELFEVPVEDRSPGYVWAEDLKFRQDLSAFLASEGALVVVRNNDRGDMAISNSAYQYHAGVTPGIPAIALAREHYERLLRLAGKGHVVRLAVDIEARYHDEDHQGYNTIAEIPGQGRNPEIVMAGAHIDSHTPGDGASDNAAGVAVVMEAVRILKALEVQPGRTIRIGLWSGEEQDYYGSAAHVRQNFGFHPRKSGDIFNYVGDYEAADLTKPFVKGRDYDRFSVYFNLDGGAGRIRGIFAEGNAAARPIFEAWLAPFQDLGATHVTLNHTKNTDHMTFQRIGLPGYQFMQDRAGGNGGAHTQLDLYDEIYAEDLKQASVILASFLYHAAMRDERMPRKPEPVPIPDTDK